MRIEIEDSKSPLIPYHNGPSRGDHYRPEQKRFIAWDGEGVNLEGSGKPQSYILFGCSTGDVLTSKVHLHTFDLLDFILRVGKDNPDAWHVGFAFNYDANMILRSLSEKALEILHRNGWVILRRKGFGAYRIEYRSSKWFSITRYGPNYDRKTNPHDKQHVKIYDLFTFFNKSFIAAYEETVGPVPKVVVEGKAKRNDFESVSTNYIQTYWRTEIDMLRQLAEELRIRLYGAGLRITQWHGPGALASYALRQNAIKKHMVSSPDEVREAARYAYAGGRFEMFQLGRTRGPVYSLDINSAYPHWISQLPSLSHGSWYHVDGTVQRRENSRLAKFGVYRVRLLPHIGGTFFERTPGPLFHRDRMGNISFPWVLEGWYWTPEVRNLLKYVPPDRYEIVEGWEYLGGRIPGEEPPFAWVADMYEQRREWKAKGYGSQLALKLCMNSLYGKMAQRVGWNQEKQQSPLWHQLEWAGWVTSGTRSMLWEIMSRIPFEHLLAVETDGLYTTMHPTEIGIVGGTGLGEWEIAEYDEIMYVQSGMAWLRKGNRWTCKRRGLDNRTFTLEHCIDYLHSLEPQQEWIPYAGETTRFVGIGSAINSSAPFKVRHCVWETKQRDINPGQGGKRIHLWKQCRACKAGLTAWDAPHDMSIRSLAYGAPLSRPHVIPWEGEPIDYPWRQHDAEEVICLPG